MKCSTPLEWISKALSQPIGCFYVMSRRNIFLTNSFEHNVSTLLKWAWVMVGEGPAVNHGESICCIGNLLLFMFYLINKQGATPQFSNFRMELWRKEGRNLLLYGNCNQYIIYRIIICTFRGSLLSLPDGLIKPFFFNVSRDTSSPSWNPAVSMSFKLTGTYLGKPACIPCQKQRKRNHQWNVHICANTRARAHTHTYHLHFMLKNRYQTPLNVNFSEKDAINFSHFEM